MISARVSLIVGIIVNVVYINTTAIAQEHPEHLTGEVTKEQLKDNNRIFRIYEQRYKPDPDAVKYLSTLEDSISVIVFFGSWCRESTKYIPGLMRSLSDAGNDTIGERYIGVDQEKKLPDKFLKKFNIKYIPTVVILKHGTEIGRIVEKPTMSMETELVQIIKRQ